MTKDIDSTENQEPVEEVQDDAVIGVAFKRSLQVLGVLAVIAGLLFLLSRRQPPEAPEISIERQAPRQVVEVEKAPETRFVEVFANTAGGNLRGPVPSTTSDYRGIYLLTEKIKRDNGRLDIDRLEPEQTSAPEITGGYLLKVDRVDSNERTFSAGGLTLIYQDPDGIGYHVIQSMAAVAGGGLPGRGLGNGLQKFGYLPEDTTDFIFAVVCEELGLIGAVVVVCLYAALLLSGFGIVRRAAHPFERLLGLGVVLTLGFQALINLLVVTGLAPTKGIALPLLSWGGTGWCLTAFSIGTQTVLRMPVRTLSSRMKMDQHAVAAMKNKATSAVSVKAPSRGAQRFRPRRKIRATEAATPVAIK